MKTEWHDSKKHYCLGFMFDEQRDLVLLIKKNKPKWQEGLYNGIGGKVQLRKDTDVYTGAVTWHHDVHDTNIYDFRKDMAREFKEEVGIETEPYQWEHCLEMYGEWFNVFVYRCFSNDVMNYKQMEEEVPCTFILSHWNGRGCISNLSWIVPLLLDDELDFPLKVPYK